MERGISGAAVLRCEFDAEGLATNCVIVSETPIGMGFGREALRSIRTGRAQTGDAGPKEVRLNFSTR